MNKLKSVGPSDISCSQNASLGLCVTRIPYYYSRDRAYANGYPLAWSYISHLQQMGKCIVGWKKCDWLNSWGLNPECLGNISWRTLWPEKLTLAECHHEGVGRRFVAAPRLLIAPHGFHLTTEGLQKKPQSVLPQNVRQGRSCRLGTTLRRDTIIAMISSRFRLKPRATFGIPWSVQLPGNFDFRHSSPHSAWSLSVSCRPESLRHCTAHKPLPPRFVPLIYSPDSFCSFP